ncbi:MAG TPA: alcohol dehydrogenase catalytic domain-containing protein [Thermodesulfobacteriota bacterium]|nr:alcohol dehydrogenase catalytic domain-containing protein [Thermodesulfobacteriota bacterium]
MMRIPEKMKAAVLLSPNVLAVKEVETPKPGPADVLIQVASCAICSSDVNLLAHPWPGQPPYGQFIPGHEYSGVIAAKGDSVDELQIGARVAVESHYGCGRCRNCRLGNYTSCLNYGKREKGHRANGFTTNGGFAQYVVNHVNTVHPIPDAVGFEEASLITNLGCVLYGFQTIGGYIVSDHVAVIGPGPLGLISVGVAKALCAGKVYLVGTRASRLQVGAALGADRLIDVSIEEPVAVVREETEGIGADLVIESSGSARGLQAAIAMARRMGKILLLGFPEEPVSADFASLARDNQSIYTVRGEGWGNCGRAVSLLASGRVDLKPLITHSFPLTEIEAGFKTFRDRIGGAVKVVVKPNDPAARRL